MEFRNSKQTDFIVARTPEEMCMLFGAILFGWPKDAGESPVERENTKLILTKKEVAKLKRLGILNRMFRRWSQMTWGWTDWSQWFEGETPRQELSHNLEGLNNGTAFISVELVKNRGEWQVMPRVYDREQIEKYGGVFEMGKYNLTRSRARLMAPQFDPEFRGFVRWIDDTRVMYGKIDREFRKDDPMRDWKVFWSQAGANLMFNCGLDLPRVELLALAVIAQTILDEVVAHQGDGIDDFILFDRAFQLIWEALSQADSRLPSLEHVHKEIKPGKRGFPYRQRVFYLLGRAFDQFILFPAGRYFGAVEVVWTDKMNYLEDMGLWITYLKEKLEPVHTMRKYKNLPDFFDPLEHWFSPCTAFRVLGKFREALSH